MPASELSSEDSDDKEVEEDSFHFGRQRESKRACLCQRGKPPRLGNHRSLEAQSRGPTPHEPRSLSNLTAVRTMMKILPSFWVGSRMKTGISQPHQPLSKNRVTPMCTSQCAAKFLGPMKITFIGNLTSGKFALGAFVPHPPSLGP